MAVRRKAKQSVPPRARRQSFGRKKSNGAVSGVDKRLAEVLAQKAATAEILKIIAGSPANLQRVLDTVAKSAAKLCDSAQVTVMIREGDVLRVRSTFSRGAAIKPPLGHQIPVRRTLTAGRAVLRKRTIQVKDVVSLLRTEYPDARDNQKRFGFRTVLSVPMMRKGEAIGVLYAWRREVRIFSPDQVALLESFADQAVIAIENARSFNETKEALERQTTTAEILKVIASSPADVQPVFDAIVQSAKRLVGGFTATASRLVGDQLHLMAFTSTSEPADKTLQAGYPRVAGGAQGEAVRTRRPSVISDMQTAPGASKKARAVARARGYRGVAVVPMLRGKEVTGVISVTRKEAGPFSGHELDLLKTFADQAVIAIENVRLFNETKEALERQTATAEILRTIGSSMTDAQPVFDSIVKNCAALFKDGRVNLRILEQGMLVPKASVGVGPDTPVPVDDKSGAGASVLQGRVIHLPDLSKAVAQFPSLQHLGLKYGFRAGIYAPLVRGDTTIGTISILRREQKGFSEKEIELLRTFADQAVIAIENVRLFNETREALERQTATAEILKVIASSPSDVQPVLDAIARSALNLLGGRSATVRRIEDNHLVLLAFTQTHDGGDEHLRNQAPVPLSEGQWSGPATAVRTGAPAVTVDAQAPHVSQRLRDVSRARGFRSSLSVPMKRDGLVIGTISVTRVQPGDFSDREIRLLQTFADQAVLAIENVRMFHDTRESLERQTATAEILKVIASSPSDVQPVFDAIAASAKRLLNAGAALVARREGDMLHLAAFTTQGEAADAALQKLWPSKIVGRGHMGQAVLSRSPVLISDIEIEPGYSENFKAMARTRGLRSIVSVPMLREGEAIGVISVNRPVAGKFSDHQTNLLRTFADQAVIAIENVRLFNETKEALERQTATGEVLAAMSSSMTDTQPVFEKIVQSLRRLFGTRFTVLQLLRDGVVEMPAVDGVGIESLRQRYPRPLDETTVGGRAMLTKQAVQFAPVIDNPETPQATIQFAKDYGFDSVIFTPMIHEGRVVGAIGAAHTDAKPFDERQIALIKTFAAQAVIAIEKVRLFNETREALEQQTATAEILQVISSSPTDTQPVFEAIVQSGLKLFPNAAVAVVLPEGNKMRMAAVATQVPAQAAAWRAGFGDSLTRDRMHGAAILDGRLVDMPDAEAEKDGPFGPGVENFLAGGNRAITIMPMICDDSAIGAISVIRATPGSLSEKQLALLRTFAAQAVIAIENVRLFNETKEALERQTATAEILNVISRSPTDVQPVFDAIVRSASRLFGCNAGIQMLEGDQVMLRAAWGAGLGESLLADMQKFYPIPFDPERTIVARTIATREITEVTDTEAPGIPEIMKKLARVGNFRSVTQVPLVRDGVGIGTLSLNTVAPGFRLNDKQRTLLQTFASQAVIAIENVRLFHEIEDKGKQLEVASQHKSNFLASMSHELRTPLNAILGFNEMILGQVYGEVPTDMQEPLTDIQTSGKHLLRLINNVLDLAKIEAGRMELSLQDYSVHDTVASVHATLRPLAAEKGLEFLASVPNDVPLAYGDGGRMAQCLMNLAGNSLKFTKAGKVEIAAEVKGELLVYKVTDTGIGIPPDKIASLFTEFKQTDATIASEYGGTGLGLSISKKFVEMHGGRIWVESEPGKGSTFIIEVPLRVKTT